MKKILEITEKNGFGLPPFELHDNQVIRLRQPEGEITHLVEILEAITCCSLANISGLSVPATGYSSKHFSKLLSGNKLEQIISRIKGIALEMVTSRLESCEFNLSWKYPSMGAGKRMIFCCALYAPTVDFMLVPTCGLDPSNIEILRNLMLDMSEDCAFIELAFEPISEPIVEIIKS